MLQIVELRPVTAGVPANGQRTRRAARLSDSKKFSSNAIQLPGVRLLEHQIRAMPSALRFSGKSVVIDPGETSPTEKDVKGGNLFTPGATATKGGRHRADTGPGFAQNLKDAAQKTIKGITGLGRDTSSSATSVKSGESGSSSSPSGDAFG